MDAPDLIGVRKLLTPAEEVSLGRRVRSALAEGRIDVDAEATLAERNLGLVYSLAKRYTRSRSHLFEDSIGPGMLGLVTAIRKFDPELGVRFTTHASWWIKAEIRKYIQEYYTVIRVPSWHRSFPENRYSAQVDAARSVSSMTTNRVFDQAETAFGRDRDDDPVDSLIVDEDLGILAEALASLPDRDRAILDLRYGDQPVNREAVAKRYGSTAMRIRRIERMSIAAIRSHFTLRRRSK